MQEDPHECVWSLFDGTNIKHTYPTLPHLRQGGSSLYSEYLPVRMRAHLTLVELPMEVVWTLGICYLR